MPVCRIGFAGLECNRAGSAVAVGVVPIAPDLLGVVMVMMPRLVVGVRLAG